MARRRTWSTDGRSLAAATRLLGCSIVLCCVVSLVQLGTLSRMSEPATARLPSALRTSDHALVFAVKSRLNVAGKTDADAEKTRTAAPRALESDAPVADQSNHDVRAASLAAHQPNSAITYTTAPTSSNNDVSSRDEHLPHQLPPSAAATTDEPAALAPSVITASIENASVKLDANDAVLLKEAATTVPARTDAGIATTVLQTQVDKTKSHGGKNRDTLAPYRTSPPPKRPSPQHTAEHTTISPRSSPLPKPSRTPQPQRRPPSTAKKTPRPVVRIPEPTVHVKRGSKGIVLCLFDRIVPLGVSLIRELRCLGNTERIEVFHCSELSVASRALLTAIDANVVVIDACRLLIDSGILDRVLAKSFQSYWLKPLAVHQTELDELLLLDADDVLLRNPAVLRSTPGYNASGTLFFYDRVVRRKEFFNRKDAVAVPVASTPSVASSSSHDSVMNATTRSSHTPKKKKKRVRHLKHWIETFDYARFGLTPHAPSKHLLASFAYRGKTCHEQDSSMVLVRKRDATHAMSVLWFLITEERFVYDFSWGDKEAFWLAYEFSHSPYFFSPWGASVVSSASNNDLVRHPRTLCGSLAHYMPVNDSTSSSTAGELLYINGKALIDPVPFAMDNGDHDSVCGVRANQVFNILPTHVTPRHVRTSVARPEQGREFFECLTELGAEPAPPALRALLWRRRVHFLAVSMGLLEPLASCSGGIMDAIDAVHDKEDSNSKFEAGSRDSVQLLSADAEAERLRNGT